MTKLRPRQTGSTQIVSGVTFHHRQDKALRWSWTSDNGRMTVEPNYARQTYSAHVRGEMIGGRYYTFVNAARAAVRAWRKNPEGPDL